MLAGLTDHIVSKLFCFQSHVGHDDFLTRSHDFKGFTDTSSTDNKLLLQGRKIGATQKIRPHTRYMVLIIAGCRSMRFV